MSKLERSDRAESLYCRGREAKRRCRKRATLYFRFSAHACGATPGHGKVGGR